MAVNMEQAIGWMEARQGKVTYSMDYRNGPNSYDCSSSVYFALMSAGAISAGWAVNTEYEHDWLIKNGYKLIAENQDWDIRSWVYSYLFFTNDVLKTNSVLNAYL